MAKSQVKLFIDGEQVKNVRFVFETPRMVYNMHTARSETANKCVGPAGFAINIKGSGEAPAWLDNEAHDVVIRYDDKELPVRLDYLRLVDSDDADWYGFGCLNKSVAVPTWVGA